MTIRLLAALAAGALFVGPAVAEEKKKLPNAPETGPAPTIVAPPVIPPAKRLASGMTLPSPHYLEGHPPQYFPEEPRFPYPNELSYQEPACPVGKLTVKVYSVADLVVPPPPVGEASKDKAKTLEAELIKRITKSVEPKSWSGAGGKGTVEYFPIGMALVVNQTPDVHEALCRFLEIARRLLDTQVDMSVMLVYVSDGCLERCGLDLKAPKCCDGAKIAGCCTGGSKTCPASLPVALSYPCLVGHTVTECKPFESKSFVKCLTATQVERMLADIQEDRATNVAAAPRITTLNGQAGTIKVGDVEQFVTGVSVTSVNGNVLFVPKTESHFMGIDLRLEPEVSADGNFVNVRVAAAAREHGVLPIPMTPVMTQVRPADGVKGDPTPFTQFIQEPKVIARHVSETACVPAGGTAVFYAGKATIERTVKETLPMVADVPVLAELFTREKQETKTNHLLVLVTAKVVKPDAAEDCDVCLRCDGKLSRLLADYGRACKDGKVEEARRLAIECLAIDPTCFGKK
jgi:hypothetical protein